MSGFNSRSFCVMPFFNLATETNGKCKICCVVMTNKYIKKNAEQDFELQSDGIQTIWNSDYMKEVRRKMWTGEKVEDCFYCNSMESNNVDNPRRQFTERWLSRDLKREIRSASEQNFEMTALPQSLEIRPGTVCNLMCVMCWSLSSSKVQSERKKALADESLSLPNFLKSAWDFELKEAERSDFTWPDHSRTRDNIKETLPNLKRVYITGGEPTLIPASRKILQDLLSLGRTDCLISFTTNLSAENTELIELAGNFDRVEVTGSLDGFDEINHYIRYPSKWSIVEKNIEMLLRKPRTFSFSIMSVIQVLNLYGYPKLLEWLRSNSETRSIHLIPTLIQYPNFLRPSVAPKEMRVTAVAHYQDLLAAPHCPDPAAVRQIIQYLDQAAEDNSKLKIDLKSFIAVNDKLRGTDINAVFPELASALS